MKVKKIAVVIFILILLIPISAFAITEKDNGIIKISPVTNLNFEGEWIKGFDIKGYVIKDNNTKELISSTHNNLGYHVFLNVNGKHGEMNGTYTLGKEKMQEMHYKEVENDKIQNIDGIDLLVTTKYINNGNQVQIIYTLKNTTKENATISLGTSADIEIDGDDKSMIEKLNDGGEVRLLTEEGKTKKKSQFVLYGKNTKGVTNIDNLWIGGWSDYYLSHIFDNNPSIKKIENCDSALTFSWVNREIKAGETKNYSVVIGIGELNTPNIEILLENNAKLYYSNAVIDGTVEDKDLKDIATIHYSIDDKEYKLSPIITQGQIKKFTLDLTKLNLLPVITHKLKVWAVDNTNSKSKIEERNFIITYLKKPKIELTEKDWTKNDVTFKISDTENEKQYIEKYQYKINNKEWIDCKTDTNITIKENGINKIDVRVVGSKIGDFSSTTTDYAKVDKISPKNTTPIASKTTNSITVQCTQTDAESGIDTTKTLYAMKEGNKWGNWQTSNIFNNLKPNTKYMIKTKSTDKVGNTSESKELEVTTEQVKENNNKNDSPNIKEETNKNSENTPNNKKQDEIIDTSILETEKDNTVANTKIPKTGENDLILPIIAILIIRALIYYIKLRKIKNRI